MKKVLGCFVIAFSLAASVRADESNVQDMLMYWQVSSSEEGYSYANLYLNTDLVQTRKLDSSSPYSTSFIDYLAQDLTGSSFHIELIGDGKENLTSDTATYESLFEQGVFDISYVGSQPAVAHSSVWTPNFAAVPEPTSGLLMLLGLAGLALKRKRV